MEAASEGSPRYWALVRARFRKNRLARVGLWVFYVLLGVSLCADFIANEKPLYCKIDGKTYYPVLKDYRVALGLEQWPEQFMLRSWESHDYEAVIFPPIRYSPSTQDAQNRNFKSPLGPQTMQTHKGWHYLGTDEIGRDVAAGMVHGTRTAMLVGVVAMSIATCIGLFFGALAGYLGDHRLRLSWIQLLGLLLGIGAGVFYAIIVRQYVLGEAIRTTSGVLSRLLESVCIFGACVGAGLLLTWPLSKLPILRRRWAIPVDILVMRGIEVINSIPLLLLILSIIAIIESPSILYVMIIIGLVAWTNIARFVRAELLRVRQLRYVEAAKALGYSELRIVLRHALPNALTPVLITIAFGVASAILLESFLSFLGIGVAADQVTWGSMLSIARKQPEAWWLALGPGLAIFVTVTIFNLIGEGLSDALDPRRR